MATEPLRQVLNADRGVMSARVLAYDWSSTTLGPIEEWPAALSIAAQLVLTSRFPQCLVWGEQQLTIHNDAFLLILGRKPSALGRSFAQVWEEAWPAIGPMVARAYDGEAVFIEDYPLWIERHDTTEQAFFTFCYSPLHDEHGKVVGMLDTVMETTAKVRNERYLRGLNIQLENELATHTANRDRLWGITTEIIVVTALDGTIRTTNPAWTRVLGWPREALHGRSIFDFLHPDDHPGARLRIDELGHGQTIWRYDCRCLHYDGSHRWISWTAVPDRGLIHSVGRDVTAERAQAQALQAVEERLHQSQKMEAVGQLTGGLAHDFNNLLAGIGGSLEQLQSRLRQGRLDDLSRYLDSAQAATRRATALTHRLLAFARRQTLAPRPIEVGQLIVDMLELIQRTIGSSIELELVQSHGAWQVRVDPNQLENALLNLCINARDAMPAGGLLTIETTNSSLDADQARELDLAAGDYLSLRVADNGTGMTAEVAARAFDPFFTTKPVGQGTGLGLSMIYGFARQSGGHAQIHSRPDQGSTISLLLPRYEPAPSAPAMSFAQPAAPAAVPVAASDGHLVLVVEDEPIVRMLIVETLEELGHRVFEAGDGAAGLALLQTQPMIDLLVSDLGLPGGMDGRQLAATARQLRPTLKVLFVSGYAALDAATDMPAQAQTQIIGKPFSIDDFSRRIGALLAS